MEPRRALTPADAPAAATSDTPAPSPHRPRSHGPAYARRTFWPLLVLAGAALVACGGAATTAPQAETATQTPAQLPGTQVAAQAILPTATSAPRAEPTLAPTPVPTATPHPLTIQAMRERDYPGSDLVVEQTLDPGVNYNRFIVSYRSEGLKIYALFTVPRGPKPPTGWPVIVFNHGFIPPGIYRTTERYVAYQDAFARNGYITIKSDYRGHGSSEGRAAGGYGAPDYVVDVMNALASVNRYPDADPNRVGMWGHSMGGYITLRAMVITNQLKAAVIWGGVVGSYQDMMYNWFRPGVGAPPPPPPNTEAGQSRSWRNQLVAEYGTPEQNPGFWASISANTYLKDLPGPIQLHHSVTDEEVPVQMSLTLAQEIKDAGGSVELYTYPGDDHNISANLGTALSRSVAFFDAHVKNA
jgi:uncharacterized protein